MLPRKKHLLRKIADDVVAKHLGDLESSIRNDLANSLVRQWLSNDGHAGFVFPEKQVWFHAINKGKNVEVGILPNKGEWGRILLRDWDVEEGEIAAYLLDLNIRHSARCRTTTGRMIEMKIEPKERTVRCRVIEGDD